MQREAAEAARLLQPAARALEELGSVHSEVARQMCEAACGAAGIVPEPSPLPWRRALLEAAKTANA